MHKSVKLLAKDTIVKNLGTCRIENPNHAGDYIEGERVLIDPIINHVKRRKANQGLSFELAGPRRNIYFDPAKTRVGIVTCGGVCPGWNNVIRAIVLLSYSYGVKQVIGFRYGQQGFIAECDHGITELNPRNVDHIQDEGGSILGTSRGIQDPVKIVDCLYNMGINILYVIGGDGSLRGALDISREATKRKMALSVIGIPKTVDNDIMFTQSFGFKTAMSETARHISAAHVEAKNFYRGIVIVKTMGRHSGFLAAESVLGQNHANFCLIPEINFRIEGKGGLIHCLEKCFHRQKEEGYPQHALIVVSEGAGQNLIRKDEKFMNTLPKSKQPKCDASGNEGFYDIAGYLQFKLSGVSENVRIIVPGYVSRSIEANATDAVFCTNLGHMAVHAGMTGKTEMAVGLFNGQLIHVPIGTAVRYRNQVDIGGEIWRSVLEVTGQPNWPSSRKGCVRVPHKKLPKK